MTPEYIDNAKVRKLKEDWVMALMQQGIVVKLHICRWSAKKQIQPEDLGIKFSDDEAAKFAERYLSLGTQKLFPPEVMTEVRSIEAKARQNLNKYSFETVWGRFVPINVFDEWKKQDAIIQSDFNKAAKMLEYRYDEIIERVKVEYSKLAKDVWARLYPEDKAGPSPSFTANFVDKIVFHIPNAFIISNSFKYSAVYYTIPMPSAIASDIAKANEIKHKAKLEEQTRKKIAKQFLAQKKELIDDFFEATVKSMRRSVRQLCENVLKSMEKTSLKEVDFRARTKLTEMIEHVRKMNFYDDTEITQLLNDLEKEIGRYKGESDEEVIANTLKKIVKESSKDFLPDDFNPTIDTLEIE